MYDFIFLMKSFWRYFRKFYRYFVMLDYELIYTKLLFFNIVSSLILAGKFEFEMMVFLPTLQLFQRLNFEFGQ